MGLKCIKYYFKVFKYENDSMNVPRKKYIMRKLAVGICQNKGTYQLLSYLNLLFRLGLEVSIFICPFEHGYLQIYFYDL